MKYKYLLPAILLGCLYQEPANALWGGIADKIYSAARNGDTATLNYYLNSGYYIDSPNSNGTTALCLAYYDKSWQAYDLLIRYGANPNNSCMYKSSSNVGKYVLGGVVVAGVAGGVVALASGGGGGGGSGGNKQDTTPSGGGDSGGGDSGGGDSGGGDSGGGDSGGGDSGGGDSGGGDSGGGDSGGGDSGGGDSGGGDSGGGDSGGGDSGGGDDDAPGGDPVEHDKDLRARLSNYLAQIGYTSEDTPSFHYYTVEDFRNSTEYNGSYFRSYPRDGIQYETVKYLDGIQAAQAYSRFYGHDAENNLVNRLGKNVIVGVIDTGVNVDHPEFADSTSESGSKVFGHNFDYGPCRSEKKNCWYISEYERGIIKPVTYQKRTFYDENGKAILVSNGYSYNVDTQTGELDEWAAMYPDDYKWEEHKDDPTPLVGKDPLTGTPYAHGTHVAGLIAANWDRDNWGMMGVAFTNTKIDAVRWDLISMVDAPIKALVDDNADIINMSFGGEANSKINAKVIADNITSMWFGYLSAAAYTMDHYETVKNKSYTAYKGPIWVKAAGNESYSEPDLNSGIKNLGKQTINGKEVNLSNLMMLVVVAADVTFKENGEVDTYTKSSFSNACGSTAKYCIAAPGGNSVSSTRKPIYSASTGNGYAGMYGTSQAAPIVAGSLAFLQEAYPFLHSSELIEILIETANTNGVGYNHNTEHYDSVYGAGLLDLGKAVNYYLSPDVGTDNIVTVSGNSVNSAQVRIDNASLHVTSVLADSVLKALPQTVTAFDRYSRPFDYPTANYIKVTHAGYKALKGDVNHIIPNQKMRYEKQDNMRFAYAQGPLNGNGMGFANVEYDFENSSAGFFFSENTRYNNTAATTADMSNPFMSFNSAYGASYGYKLHPLWNFRFEAVGGNNGLYDGDFDYNDSKFYRQAYGFNSEVEFNPQPKWSLTFSSGMLHEDDALLGMNGEGAFGMPESNTYHTGIRAAWKTTPKLTLSGSYFAGFTQAQNFSSSMLRTSDLISDSFAFDANYKYDSATDFGFRLSSPLKIQHGKLYVDFPAGRDYYSDEVYRNSYAADLKSKKREYKLALYLNKDLSEHLSISSEVNVRFNPEHRDDKNDYRALFGLSWSF